MDEERKKKEEEDLKRKKEEEEIGPKVKELMLSAIRFSRCTDVVSRQPTFISSVTKVTNFDFLGLR